MPRGGEDFRQLVDLAASHQHAPRSLPSDAQQSCLSAGGGRRRAEQAGLGTLGCGQTRKTVKHWDCCPQGIRAILQGTTVEKRPQQGPAMGPGLISRALTLPV